MIKSHSTRKAWESTNERVMVVVENLTHEYQVYKANPSLKAGKRLIRSVRNAQRMLGEIANSMKKGVQERVEPKRANKTTT